MRQEGNQESAVAQKLEKEVFKEGGVINCMKC